MVGRVQELVAPNVMEIVLYGAVTMRRIGAHCVTSKFALVVVHRVRGRVEVPRVGTCGVKQRGRLRVWKAIISCLTSATACAE